jgi:hypothetical protein
LNKNNIIIVCLLLTACSAPESDGIKAAKQFCDYENAMIEYRQKNYSALIKLFDTSSFQTRLEIREKIQEINDKAVVVYNNRLLKAEQNYRKLIGKYATNFNKNAEFGYAFQGYYKTHKPNEDVFAPLLSQIEKLILSVIPPVPDIEKIKQDLTGHEIKEQPKFYFNQNRRWLIEKDKIIDIEITNIKKIENDYLFEIYLIFQSGNSAYEALIDLTYVLYKNDDWTIEFIGSKKLVIIKTGKYENYITAQIKGWSGEYELEFTNYLDIPLLVGGMVYSEFSREWSPFSTVVNGNNKNSVGGLFSVSVIDYVIHFIERP